MLTKKLKKSQVAKSVVDNGATMRDDRQSTRLLDQANKGTMNINPDYPSITQSSWFLPAMFAGGAFLIFMLVRK